ncbi:Uncharacterized protein TCM_017365 [Theobroma cacao]|uniref:Uncharacterized protein n=1 Tax=Theobroma cacao TaxID=3641 RepID=A0A061EDG4_THECC|nr:Uncharacterized protein TCM_017365 [Theobroma cacao]
MKQKKLTSHFVSIKLENGSTSSSKLYSTLMVTLGFQSNSTSKWHTNLMHLDSWLMVSYVSKDTLWVSFSSGSTDFFSSKTYLIIIGKKKRTGRRRNPLSCEWSHVLQACTCREVSSLINSAIQVQGETLRVQVQISSCTDFSCSGMQCSKSLEDEGMCNHGYMQMKSFVPSARGQWSCDTPKLIKPSEKKKKLKHLGKKPKNISIKSFIYGMNPNLTKVSNFYNFVEKLAASFANISP